MTISREARIIFAILGLTAAVFIWLNFFTGSDLNFGLQPNANPVAADTTAPTTTTNAIGAAAPGTEVAVIPTPESAAPLVARDFELPKLPFLVTSRPEPLATDEAAPAAEGGTINRPQSLQRISVNPFSPIIVQRPPVAAAPAPSVPNRPSGNADIQIVSIPSAPPASAAPIITPPGLGMQNNPLPATGPAVTAPSPRALTPPSPQTQELPRALPGGTLPVVPDILRQVRTVDEGQPDNLASVAALRVPQASDLPTPAGTQGATATAEDTPEPLMLETAVATPPLDAGTNSLSRYLRDNNVRFTGTVLGPVGVGVFRSSLSDSPIIVTLGQLLPDTQIVLTNLKGEQAELTQDSYTQTLILDLRR